MSHAADRQAGRPADEQASAGPPPALELQGVRFRWPRADRDVLDIASLRLEPGERLMLRGPSGCGKSTLLSLVAGVTLADDGAVRVLGEDWRRFGSGQRDRRRADHIGYIFQQFNLLPYLSVLDNVLLPCRFSPLRARHAGDGAAAQGAAASALLDALEMEPSLWPRDAGRLSVGQQQRVAAARALIGRPEMVVADEPTSALDEVRRDRFMDLLGRACRQAGSALLFVSHDPRLAAHFDRVVDLPELNRASRVGEAA